MCVSCSPSGMTHSKSNLATENFTLFLFDVNGLRSPYSTQDELKLTLLPTQNTPPLVGPIIVCYN